MSEKAKPGYGTLVHRGNGASPEAFEVLGEVGDIKGPNLDSEELDGTDQQSLGGFKEKVQGLRDGGTISFQINWLPETQSHQNLFADYYSGIPHTYRITFKGAGAFRFVCRAFVKSLPVESVIKGKRTSSVTLTVTGKPTLEQTA